MRRKLRVHFKYVEQIVPVYLVQVAVSQCPDVTARLANRLINTHVLAEYVLFACNPRPFILYLLSNAFFVVAKTVTLLKGANYTTPQTPQLVGGACCLIHKNTYPSLSYRSSSFWTSSLVVSTLTNIVRSKQCVVLKNSRPNTNIAPRTKLIVKQLSDQE